MPIIFILLSLYLSLYYYLYKPIEKHISETLLTRPIHSYQHAFQTGKSCEFALQQLVVNTQ